MLTQSGRVSGVGHRISKRRGDESLRALDYFGEITPESKSFTNLNYIRVENL